MRAALLLVSLVVLVGCGRNSDDRMASMTASAPMVESAAKMKTEAFALGGRSADAAKADGAVSSDKPQAQLAAMQTPVAVPRLIVRNAQLALRVTNVEEGERKVGDVARTLGGTVEGSQGADLAGPEPSMTITLRVPEIRFDDALRRLEALGTRLNKSISSEDVTSQAVDLDARLKSLRVQEDAYRAILSAARKISDVLEIQERLTGVRTEIEQIVAQRRGLGDQAARSTIAVTLTQVVAPVKAGPPPVEPNWLATTWSDATGALRGFGIGLAQIVIWFVAMLPILIPLAFLSFLGLRWVNRTSIKVP